MYHESSDENMVDEESPWMDDGEETNMTTNMPDARVSQQEWDKLSLRYSDAGYRDGITAGKNAKLQTGFDQGFALAAPFARQVGQLRGVAASVLALLTTASAKKHASTVIDTLLNSNDAGGQQDRVVSDLRQLVTALGKLDEPSVVPVDQEALAHARQHEDEVGGGGGSLTQVMQDRQDLRQLESLMEGLGEGSEAKRKDAAPGEDVLAQCRAELERLLDECGLRDVLPPPPPPPPKRD